MVQVRDNGKVCRLAVPPGVFALPNRWSGESQQFNNGMQAPLGIPPCPVMIRTITESRQPEIPSGLTPDNAQSRQITVNHAYFSRIAHQPVAAADQVNQGKSR